MFKNSAINVRKLLIAGMLVAGAALLVIALIGGDPRNPISEWTPVNEPLKKAVENWDSSGDSARNSENADDTTIASGDATHVSKENSSPIEAKIPGQAEGNSLAPDNAASITVSPDANANEPSLALEPSPSVDAQPASTEDFAATDKRIDLNRATLADLETLPGIGPSKAQAIVAYRDKVGGFRKIEQLKDVKGIGPKVFERISGQVRIAAGK
ncbi:ComEA family DNA-binding protein [Cohnella boryungensis]|uniref:ComEA family DNA-binding protein n=1 Tax=Cohnella boryungensis TaxID=768479 RepID=A0ABV8SF92_9BACL